jgi:hypothetical protein
LRVDCRKPGFGFKRSVQAGGIIDLNKSSNMLRRYQWMGRINIISEISMETLIHVKHNKSELVYIDGKGTVY